MEMDEGREDQCPESGKRSSNPQVGDRHNKNKEGRYSLQIRQGNRKGEWLGLGGEHGYIYGLR